MVTESLQRLAYVLDDRGSSTDRGNDRNFSPHHRVQTGSGAHPASYPVGTWGKVAEAWSYRSPPSSAEAENAWSYKRVYPQFSGLAAWRCLSGNFWVHPRTSTPPITSCL